MEVLLLIGAAATAVLAVLALARRVWRAWQRVEAFLSDWFGEPARPGVPGRCGVMERLARVEQQVTPNGGGSFTLADRVVRLERHAGTEPTHTGE